MRILTWNVNGLKSCLKLDFEYLIRELHPEIICLQEIKMKKKILKEFDDYHQFWNSGRRDGYSGVLVLSKVEPISCRTGFGLEEFDVEGRILTLEFSDFILVNLYAPQSKNSLKKSDYRKKWDMELQKYVQTLKKPVVMCGDFNVGHTSLDISNKTSKDNPLESGFLQIDRENFEKLLNLGFIDTFRYKYPDKIRYTCWSNKSHNIERSMDKRLDYFLVSESLKEVIGRTTMNYGTRGSDHCPVMLRIEVSNNFIQSEEDIILAEQWDSVNWKKTQEKLLEMQIDITKSATNKDWKTVSALQQSLIHSLEARLLAVRQIEGRETSAGVDGIVWSTSAKKMKAVYDLDTDNYVSMPFRSIIIRDGHKRKERRINIPTFFDRAMQTLQSYALSPVAEATGDSLSFGGRKGRSTLDACSHIKRLLSDSKQPLYVLRCDVKAFYENISHLWLEENIPIDKGFLREFLKAGYVFEGETFSTLEGVSLGSGISSMLANMTLNRMQNHIFSSLRVSNSDRIGKMVRFIDDFIVIAESEEQAVFIKEQLKPFLEERGLRLSEEKTKIFNACDGFDFLAVNFQQKRGKAVSFPSKTAVTTYHAELEELIMNHNDSLDSLIRSLNSSLYGFSAYHRSNDCEESFRYLDVVVQEVLIRKVKKMHPQIAWGTLKKRYWYEDRQGHFLFAHPDNKTLRVMQLSKVAYRQHLPVNEDFNYFMDIDWYDDLQEERKVQKLNGKNKAIWTGQDGFCYFCGRAMLPDQKIRLIQIKGKNHFIHKHCQQTSFHLLETEWHSREVHIEELLEKCLGEDEKEGINPYFGLDLYFLKETRQLFTVTFEKIAEYIASDLPDEAYHSIHFWHDEMGFGHLEKEDKFPKEAILSPRASIDISNSWLKNGFIIHKLDLEQQKITFKKEIHRLNQLKIPKQLLETKISANAAHEIETYLAYIVEKYGY